MSKEAVRMRVKRGMLRSEKGENPPSRGLRRAHSAAGGGSGDSLERASSTGAVAFQREAERTG